MEGLEVETPPPSPEQSDVIAQLMDLVQSTSEQAVQAVESAEQEAIEKISALPSVNNHVITFGVSSQEGEINGDS